jgi:hypothetical protein
MHEIPYKMEGEHNTLPLIALDFWLCVKENQLFMTNLVQYVTGSSNTFVS